MLFGLFTVMGLFHYSSENIFAYHEPSTQETESILFLFKEGTNLKNIQSELEANFTNLDINSIEEIGLLKIESTSDVSNEIRGYINTAFKGETIDELQDVYINAPTLNYSHIEYPNHLFPSIQMNQWNIREVTNNYQTYAINKGNKNVKIGVIDSGIDITHPALKNNIVAVGESFVPGQTSAEDYIGHGTMVAGIIAANGKITGVGPELGLVPYKVFDTHGAYSSDIIAAIVEAVNDNVDIINLSLSTTKIKETEKNIIKAYEKAFMYAKKNDVIIVASAGNQGMSIDKTKADVDLNNKGKETIIYLPGSDNEVVTVAAVTKGNKPTSYSNFGKTVDISAPGGDLLFNNGQFELSEMIITTYPITSNQTILGKLLGLPKGYEPMIGTSLAAPHVTGSLGVMISYYEEKYDKKPPVNYLKNHLYKYATPMKEQGYGKGSLDLYKSLINM